MFDRFSDRSKKVMQVAREEAQRLRHSYLGPEHILLGLASLDGGVAIEVLKQRGIDGRRIRTAVEAIARPGDPMPAVGHIPFTPSARKVLELSMEEHESLGHDHIGTEHLLLGLIKQNESVAAQALAGLGMKLADTREAVLAFLGADGDRTERRSTPSVLAGFTDRGKRVLHLAREEALRLRHQHLGTEHILLGIARLDRGGAVELLDQRGIDRLSIARKVEAVVKAGSAPVDMVQIPFTPGAKKVLELTLVEAQTLGHTRLGTEHLLLGLLREEYGIAARVLHQVGLRLDDVRKDTAERLGADGAADAG